MISNMLGLKDDTKVGCQHLQRQHSPSSVTKEVELYSSLRKGGVTVHMVDMPSLNSSDMNDAKAMATTAGEDWREV